MRLPVGGSELGLRAWGAIPCAAANETDKARHRARIDATRRQRRYFGTDIEIRFLDRNRHR
jgi:hypothetical protein